MAVKRLTNAELVERFRHTLTHGFQAFDEKGEEMIGDDRDRILAQTKRWRSELWVQLRELEARLCPKPDA